MSSRDASEDYLNTTDSAAYLGVTPPTFRALRDTHQLQSFTRPGKGKSKFFKKADLERLRGFMPDGKREEKPQ